MKNTFPILAVIVLLTTFGCAQLPQRHEILGPQPQTQEEQAKTTETDVTSEQPSEQELKARTNQLLKRLASNEYKKRENAQAELAKLLCSTRGGLVLERLQSFFKKTVDPEVKQRLEKILEPYTLWCITPVVLDAIPNIIGLLEEDSRKSRRVAVEALRKLDPKEARGTLFSIVVSNGFCGRRRSLEAILEHADSQVLESFISILENPRQDGTLLHVTCYALERIGKEAISPLSKLLHDTDNPSSRELAANLLEKFGDEGRRILVEAARTGKTSVKAAALDSLASSHLEPPPLDLLLELIKGDDQNTRCFAIQLLGRTSSPQAVDVLSSLLAKDNDGAVRNAAAYALRSTGDSRCVPFLIKALEDEDKYVRIAATQSLQGFGDQRAIEPLARLLNDENLEVAGDAAHALVAFGPQALKPLLLRLKSGNSDFRNKYMRMARHARDEDTIPVLLGGLKDTLASVRAEAAYTLHKYKEKEVVDALIASLTDDEGHVRSSAAIALGEIADAKAAPALLKALEDQEEFVRSSAATSLGMIGDSAAVVPLTALLKDESYSVRGSAVRSLVEIGDKRAFNALGEAIKNPGDLNMKVPYALYQMGGKRAIPYLVELLGTRFALQATWNIFRFGPEAAQVLFDAAKSENPSIRINALEGLAMLREEKAFDMLLKALKDKKHYVRSTAAGAIGLYRDTRAVQPLISLLKDEDDAVKLAAVDSLAIIGSRDSVEPLIKVLQETDFRGLACTAANGLYSIGDPAAIEPLVSMLLDDWPIVRYRAALALRPFKEKRVADALLAMLEGIDCDARLGAAITLAEMGDKRAIEPIARLCCRDVYLDTDMLRCLQDLNSPEVVDFLLSALKKRSSLCDRRRITIALGKTGDKRAVGPLKRLLKDPDTETSLGAAAALLSFNDENAAALLDQALQSQDTGKQEAAARALCSCPHPQALPWLIRALKSQSGIIRDVAARALGGIKDKRASKALIGSLHDPDEQVCFQVVYSLGRLSHECAIGPLIDVLSSHPNDDLRKAAHDVLYQITGQNFGWNVQRWRRWYEKNKDK